MSDLAKKLEKFNILKHDYATTYPLEIPDLQIKMVYLVFLARLIVRMPLSVELQHSSHCHIFTTHAPKNFDNFNNDLYYWKENQNSYNQNLLPNN